MCQNECQRAIADAIAAYEKRMRRALEEAKAQMSVDVVGREHRKTREEAVAAFKSKAVGQDVQDFEVTLRDGISKKYKEIKDEFNRFCKI